VDRQHVNIQHILASLALKATRQSVIIAKLSSYPRKNRTKKALWELDNLRALKRGESYHKLVRAVAYANGGKLRVRTDQEQQLWSECSRLLANCIIYYNACILSELLERAERRQDYQRADAIKRANPASWKHVNLYGAYSIETRIGNHTFRATGITAYLKNSGKLEVAQQIANHESPRTTKLYDRRQDEISLDEIERITI
jgi:Tn3 transposase DDE domain